MFRTTCYVHNFKTLLDRTRPSSFQIASITRFSPNNASKRYGEQRLRMPCSVPPPQPVESLSSSRNEWISFTLTFAAGFTGGILLCWAHNSKEIRDWFTLYAPWLDDLISVIYQEDMNYIQFVSCCIKKFKHYMKSMPISEKPCNCESDSGEIKNIHQEPKPEQKSKTCIK